MPAQTENYQVFKRSMTDPEGKSVDKVYKNAQKQARPAGFFALVFAAIGIFSGATALDLSTLKGLTAILVLLIGLLAFGLAFFMFRVRKTVTQAHNDGYVVVVRGPVSRFDGKMNTSAMMVGPLAIGWNKRTVSPLQEGSFAEVACIPKLRSVVSINGAGLDQPIRVVIPNDLEAKAFMGPPTYQAQPMNTVSQNATSPTSGMSFCPSCGKPASGLAFCSDCGNKL
ncbi:MAG: hypothetical protein ABR986_01965 [Methanomassiliicoccales archaeon]|jgi:hypothetical protein